MSEVKMLLLGLVVLVTVCCNTQPGTYDQTQAQACKDRGGSPVSIYNGHVNTTTICFAPDVLR